MAQKFNRRHYEAIAETIRNHKLIGKSGTEREKIEVTTIQNIITGLGTLFANDSKKYNHIRFVAKCGWTAGSVKSE